MKRKIRNPKFPYVVLIAAIVILVANILNAYPDKFDRLFYITAIANAILIVSMLISIRSKKKEKL